jgi:hypothetical protein
MRIDEAEARLHSLLSDAGVDPRSPTFQETWTVFRSFATEPVETKSDGVLVQGAAHSFYGFERYTFDFVRQFEVVDGDGEFDHYEQLHCEFCFDPAASVGELASFTEWWFADGGSSLDDFLDEIERRREFAAAVGAVALTGRVEQEAV